MNLYSKLSALGAVLVLSTAFASADTLTFGSYGNAMVGTPSNTAVLFNGFNSVGAGVATFNIPSGSPGGWAPAGPNSSWVSNDANAYPGGSSQPMNGIYNYSSTFSTTGGVYRGALTVLADDTTDVYLNGVQVVAAGVVGTDSHCSDMAPSCLTPLTVAFGSSTAGFNSNGLNTVTFGVRQTGHYSEGLDFYGGTTTVPEPSSLMLLGTGLIGSAGALFRRMRA